MAKKFKLINRAAIQNSLNKKHFLNADTVFLPFQGYKVYYTTNPSLHLSQWESQFVDNNKLTTVSDLMPHTIYTIRVEAYTAIGPGPPSPPVQVILEQGFKLTVYGPEA